MKRLVQAIYVASLLAFCNLSSAQAPVRNYSFAQSAGTYTAITGTNSIATGDDASENGIPIGFNFFFGGRGVTHFCLNTNGFIKLGIGTTANPVSNTYINNLTNSPSPVPFSPCIAAFWDDNHRYNGLISYATTGAVGSRVLTVQWNNVNVGSGDSSLTLLASFQIKLFEGTNVVKIIYSNTFDNAGPITASIGLNDQTSFLSVTPGATPTVSSVTANNAISSLTDIRGKEYTFTPPVPLCSPVSSLAASNITSSGALLTVNTVSGATGYRFSVSTTADYPTSSTLSGTPTFTLSGLLPNTKYYAQAQAVCSGGNSSAWYTTEFTTGCAALALPYFQNFDSIVAPALPVCMTKEDLNAGASWNTSAASGQSYSAPNCMVYSSDPGFAGNDWFYTPPITLTGGTNYRLLFYYKNQSSTAAEKLEVKYGTGPNAAAMTNLIVSNSNITNTNYNVLQQDFTPASSGAYYFGFHNFSNAGQLALNIDDIRISTTPSCGVPTLLNVSFTSATTGIASWTAPTTGTVSGYQYLVSTSATPPASGTANSTTSVNISGLVAGQQYYLHVRTVCASNSAWSTYSFVPPCTVKQVPYFENFDTSVVVPALQRCFTSQDLNGGTKWNSGTGQSRSTPNCMVYNWDANLPGDDWFFTPPIHLTAGLSYWLSYYTKGDVTSSPEKLEVKYGTANNAAAMVNLLTSNTITTATYFQVFKSFTPAATGDYYFGFHSFSDANQFNLYVDDIRVNYSTECGPPTNVSITTNTASSGTASWSPSATGTASNYQYVITNSATPPETGATVTNTPSASFSGLQPASQYYLHVKSLCTSGLYSTWTTYPFITPCAAVNIPYTENFNAVTVPALPSCMSIADVNGGVTWQTDAFASCTPTKAMVYKPSTTLPADDWVFLPGMNLTAGVTYELNFNYKACTNSYQEKLEVKFGNANNVGAMSNLLYSNLNINQTSYQLARAGFTPAVSGVYYIGFHAISPANQYNLYIDDINVVVSTFCGQPTNPVVTLTSDTTGTIIWSRPVEGTAASYQYELSTSNIPSASSVAVTDTSASFSAIAGTRFFLHLRTNCANGNVSAWTTTTFTTGCMPRSIPYAENFDIVPTPYLGNCMTSQDLNGGATWKTDNYKPRSAPNSMLYRYDQNLPGNDWAYTPGLSLIGGVKYRLTFYYKARGYNERLLITYGGAPVADSMIGSIWDNIFNDSTAYSLGQVDFTAQRTGVFYIGFKAFSVANQWDLNVDDIRVDYAPGCSVPTNFSTTITSQTTATVSWAAPYNGPALSYEFAYSSLRTNPSGGTNIQNGTSANLSGLIPGIKLYMFVRSICGGSAVSAWAIDSIYIPCIAKVPPYTENFDGVAVPILAPCISIENLNGGNTWLPATYLPKSAPNSMVYKFNSAQPGNDWFYTAPLQLTGGTSYRLTFFYKGRSSGSVEKLEVKYGLGNNVNSMSNLIFADTSIRSTEYLQTQNEFTPVASGVYYIGFHAFSNANQFDLNVDDIRLEATPNCGKPTDLNIAATSNSTATASWNTSSAGTLSAYEYVVSTSAALPEAGTLVNSNSALLTGLIPTQQYYLHVRKVCTGAQLSLWSTIPFIIPCQAYALPYYENFDTGDLPLLPPCMAVENVNGGNTWSRNELGSNSFPFSAFYTADAGRNADDWLFTPTVNFTAGLSYRVSFYYKAENAGLTEKMEVKYGNGNTASAMTNLLMTDTNINFTAFRLYTVDFIPATSGAFNIGFHAISLRNKSFLYVDDIRVERSPNCGNPVNLAVHLTSGSAGTVTWSPSNIGVPVNYEYAISTSSSDPVGSGIALTDSFSSFNGLNFFTQYYFHVRTVCTNGASIWVSKAFYTLPNDSACTALPLTLNGASSCGNTTFATAISDPALPSNCNTTAANFTVWYKYTPAVNGMVYLKAEVPVTNSPLYGSVGWYTLSGNCNSAASFTLMPGTSCQEFGQSGTGDADILPSPALTAGTTYYIMISGVDYNYGDYCLSLLSTAPPSCTNNLYPSNNAQIDPVPGPANDLTFRWSSVAGATGGYDLVLDSTYPPTAFRVHVTDTFYKYTGINYNKAYFWYVLPKDNVGNSTGCLNNYSTFSTYNASNCRPLTNYGCSAGDSISYFSLKGEAGSVIRNNSGNSCGQDLFFGYSDYINSASATLEPGFGYTGFVKTGVANNYVSIWIDFNNNGFFEPTERLLNNFKAGPTRTLYSILIPQNVATGDRRLRIRNIYSDTKPTSPTDPCNYYDYSETEDYRVTIANSGSVPRSAANGTPGSCEIVSATTIDAASNNINAAVPVLDSTNRLVAVIYPEGNTLGRVNGNLYIHNGAIRKNNGPYYLNRNITIKPEIQPATSYRCWMYYWASELDALIAAPGSGVATGYDLVMTKTKQDSCSSGIANYQVTDTVLIPSGYGFQGDQGNLTRYIVVDGVNSFSTFYLNGHHTYRFTGNGNWSDAANWENQNKPPAILPQGDLIIIDNTVGGQCILDISQRVSFSGSIIVNNGKKLVIPGGLQIQ